jgi:hypothetical protein
MLVVAFATTTSTPQPIVAQPHHPPGGDAVLVTIPQFTASLVRFKALDETGWDWAGSDEVHIAVADFNSVQQTITSTYEDVDSGETKNIRAADQCVERLPTCVRGAANLHFGFAMWERDKPPFPFADWCNGYLSNSTGLYYSQPCSGDDFIGRVEVSWPQADLAAALPAVGGSFERTVKPTGGAGSYTITYRITRIADARGRPVVGPERPPVTVPPPISLQASVNTSPMGSNVKLNWTGASTASVDVYRDGAKIATTPNDGQYMTAITAPGTYQYRVCNAGSTTFCSADVTVVVT